MHEEIEHIRQGKHGAKSAKQAIAIGLSKARRAGVKLPPPGAGISKHRHLGQDEILFLQTGTAHVVLNDKEYDVHAGGMVFFPMNTWVTLENTGSDDIQLIFVFSAPGFEQYMRCTSVAEGQAAAPMTVEAARECSHKGHVEYEALEKPVRK